MKRRTTALWLALSLSLAPVLTAGAEEIPAGDGEAALTFISDSESALTGDGLDAVDEEQNPDGGEETLLSLEEVLPGEGEALFDSESGAAEMGTETLESSASAAAAEEDPVLTDEALLAELTGAAPVTENASVSAAVLSDGLWQAVQSDWVYSDSAWSLSGVTLAGSRASITTSGTDGSHTGMYFFDSASRLVTGNAAADESGVTLYYAGEEEAVLDDWAEGQGKTPYNSTLGQPLTGWARSGEVWTLYEDGASVSHGIVASALNEQVTGGDLYLVSAGGELIKNAMKKAENGETYFTDGNGKIYTGQIVTYEGDQYYVGEDGALVDWKNSYVRCPGEQNRFYYFGSTAGKIEKKKGWQKITENGKVRWFYFAKSGKHLVSKWSGGKRYYFTAEGYLASGVTIIGKKGYYFTPSTKAKHKGKLVKGKFIRVKHVGYLASSDGTLKEVGWKKINKKWYYFENFRTVRNQYRYKGKTYGYLNNDGVFTSGWVVVSDDRDLVRYIDGDSRGYAKNKSLEIDGLRYYFDANGYRINDLTSKYTSGYSVKVDRINGVATVYAANGKVPVRSIRVSVGASETPTPVGTYSLQAWGTWVELMGPSYGQYGTLVVGGIFFHSIPVATNGDYTGVDTTTYYTLGTPASHGCIRCCVADAKFVYENCDGASCTIFDGVYNDHNALKGPLGKRKWLGKTDGADPTDLVAHPENADAVALWLTGTVIG